MFFWGSQGRRLYLIPRVFQELVNEKAETFLQALLWFPAALVRATALHPTPHAAVPICSHSSTTDTLALLA